MTTTDRLTDAPLLVTLPRVLKSEAETLAALCRAGAGRFISASPSPRPPRWKGCCAICARRERTWTVSRCITTSLWPGATGWAECICAASGSRREPVKVSGAVARRTAGTKSSATAR